MKDRLKYLQEDVILHITLLMLLIAYTSKHEFITKCLLIYAILQFINSIRTAINKNE